MKTADLRKRVVLTKVYAVMLVGVSLIAYTVRRLVLNGDLLLRSTLVATVIGDTPLPIGFNWISDHEVVTIYPKGLRTYQGIHVDSLTQIETILPPFSSAVNAVLSGKSHEARLSPDGRWLLWRILRRNSSVIRVERLDGTVSHETVGPLTCVGYVMWLPDSRYWVEFNGIGKSIRPVVHGLDGSVRASPLIDRSSMWFTWDMTDHHALTVDVQNPYYWFHGRKVRMTDPLPSGYTVCQVAFRITSSNSQPWPHCDRIAYCCNGPRNSTLNYNLERWFPWMRNDWTSEYSLWTSRSDGSEVQEVGGLRHRHVSDLQWTPDGKHLSFVHDDAMYTVRAD